MSQGDRVEFFFDYSSPFAYLGATQVERVVKASEGELIWTPFLLGGLFQSIGTPMVPLFEMPEAKRKHASLDMYRWASFHNVPLNFPTNFPMNTVKALRMTLQLEAAERASFAQAVFHAYWADDRDINDAEVLMSIATELNLDGEAMLQGCAAPEVKLALRSNTERAEQVGVCGAPSFLVTPAAGEDSFLFWGQDRLPFVTKILEGWRPSCG